MAAVQIAPVAERAGIAAGTVYRYFPSKTDLVAALVSAVAERRTRRAACCGRWPRRARCPRLPPPSRRSHGRALRHRRLAWALLAEPVDAEVDAVRLSYRRALVAELETCVRAAMSGGQLPEQDAALAAPALVGVLIEGLIGPLAPDAGGDEIKARAAVQALTLFALRALGVADARARGLVVQIALPAEDGAA